ncbi:cilia- and flagella-associated protein 77-like isoform X2 [Gigantopelta aegis]|uniref:cilia- and flagella-associated protein 77-like isoform X2 n=1 Tax=Gigantopelta aegis TaxID=1735272 RepID=UPI001B88E70E|nr:cilia- and flagella-associated protein 77-like isoform X2 [Gigantopelta aegis]
MKCSKKDKKFVYTATGYLGEKRDTMLENELLLRPKLGIPRSRGLKYPGEGFIFGVSTDSGTNTAAEALRGWPGLPPLGVPQNLRPKTPERDFMALNCQAVHNGLVKAPEYNLYRATHDIRVQDAEVSQKEKESVPLYTKVYGMPTRPSTPIFDVLEHKFQERWLQRRRLQDLAARRSAVKQKECRGYVTRSAMLRTFQNPVEPPPLWQMPRFAETAKPHLQTFRTTKAKKDAFDHFCHDKIGRQGTFGEGVYKSAVY